VGASGAVFGLFAVSVLVRLRPKCARARPARTPAPARRRCARRRGCPCACALQAAHTLPLKTPHTLSLPRSSHRCSLRSLLEAAVLGQFVWTQVAAEAGHQLAGGVKIAGMSVGHVAHLAGAVAGVLLVWSLSRLPAAGAGDE